MEAQSLQLSTEQVATSSASSSVYLNTGADVASTSSVENSHLVSSSSSPSSGSVTSAITAPSVPVSRSGKSRPARKSKPRTSPYPVSPTVAVAASSIVSESVVQHPHDEYSNPMMDYRYDLQQSTSSSGNHHQYLTSTMYSAYNSNEVQLYNYGPNGVAEAATGSGSNHSGGDLYNPYYETDNMAAYPGSATLRHYTNLTEGICFKSFKNRPDLIGIFEGDEMEAAGSDMYSSSENSPESHQRLMQHHHQQVHHHHHQQLLASRLSPVSPATSSEDHHQQQQYHHQQMGVLHQHHPAGISVISNSHGHHQQHHQQQHHLPNIHHQQQLHNGPDEDSTRQQQPQPT